MNRVAAQTQRGTRELWLDAAYEALVEGGVEAVRVMPLAENLSVSRTSFYWHFEDRDALLNALIAHWRDKNTGNLIRQTRLFAETICEAVLNLFDCWIDPDLFDARLEFAMRNWSQSSAELKETFRETDRERIEAIRDMFARFDFDPYQADIRANAIYLTQVGYISIEAEEPLPERIRRMPAYVETFTGRAPSQSEIDRFMARHRSRLDG
ncbi:MAG: TetR/AcrR family transcriptional regulator [Dichotomicrobium sp.]